MVTVIGLLGLAGAGKTTALEHLTAHSPFRKSLQMKQIAKQEYESVDENGVEYLPVHIQQLAKEHDMVDDITPNGNFTEEISEWVDDILFLSNTYFAKKAVEHIQEEATETDVWVVDGLRTVADVGQLAEHIDDTHFLYLHVPFHIRSERLLDRGREGEDSLEDIVERDEREFEWGLDVLLRSESEPDTNYSIQYVSATHDNVSDFVTSMENTVQQLTE